MSNPEYHSAIYKINPNKQIATRIIFKDYNCTLLPKKIEFNELAEILSKMQKICFEDKNVNNENTNRIIDLLLEKKDKTFIVAISLGYLPGVSDVMDFVDGGAATVQKSNLDFLKFQQPWINEVCRSKFTPLKNSTKLPVTISNDAPHERNILNLHGYNDIPLGKSPVNIVMEMIEKYIKLYLMKTSKKIDGMYLYVEKNPDHGNPDFLLKYYEKYGFKKMAHEDSEYFYMYKGIKHSPSKLSTNVSLKKSTPLQSTVSPNGSLEKKGGKKTRRNY